MLLISHFNKLSNDTVFKSVLNESNKTLYCVSKPSVLISFKAWYVRIWVLTEVLMFWCWA